MRGHRLFSAERRFRNTARQAHEAVITARLRLSNHELNGAPWTATLARKSEYLSQGAVRLTWRPLPNPQHPREMTHVVLRQHKPKLVVQHYSLCVNMGPVECGGNTDTHLGQWCWYSHQSRFNSQMYNVHRCLTWWYSAVKKVKKVKSKCSLESQIKKL